MQRLIVSAMLAAPVMASKCNAGRKHAKDLTAKFCSTSATDAASCDNHCCVDNLDTCGGRAATTVAADKLTCPFGTYAPMTDSWKNTKTTKKTMVTDCCHPTVTCDNTLYSCPAGYKKKSAVGTTKCPAGPKSCAGIIISAGTVAAPTAWGGCCTPDTSTCGGWKAQSASQPTSNTAGASCPTPTDYESVILSATDDAWKKKKVSTGTAFTNTLFQNQCCMPKPTCSSLTCGAGYKASTANKNKFVGGATVKVSADGTSNEGAKDTAAATILAAGACCVKDTDVKKKTCGTISPAPACAGGTFYNAKAFGHVLATSTNKDTVCCAPVATCALAVCDAGYKKKANVEKHSCSGNHLTCSTTCCEVDKTTCGGIGGITCAYGTYDESTTWVLSGDAKTSKAVMDAWKSRAATAATKNTVCCTAAAQCKVEVGTTTPAAAAVTTTPAVPV